jgi:hypothetical protein
MSFELNENQGPAGYAVGKSEAGLAADYKRHDSDVQEFLILEGFLGGHLDEFIVRIDFLSLDHDQIVNGKREAFPIFDFLDDLFAIPFGDFHFWQF